VRTLILKEVISMENKPARWMIAIIAMAMVATFVLFTATPVLAQDEQPQDSQEKEIPPELQAKMEEFKDAAEGLRECGKLLKADVRQFRAGVKELFQEARSLPRDEKWDLFDEVSAARDEYIGTVQEKIETVRETAGAMKESLAAAREAWEQDNLDGALSGLDQAIAQVGEVKGQLDEAHQLFQEILEVLRQLGDEAGATPAEANAWTV